MINAEDHIELVHHIAKKFRDNDIFDYDDLVGYGMIGLVKAAKDFDETKGFKFSTYAVPKIYFSIKQAFRDYSGRICNREARLKIYGSDNLPLVFSHFIVENTNGDCINVEFTSGDTTDEIIDKVNLDIALSKLDKRMQDIFYLYYVKGLNQTEVGIKVGLSQISVSRKLAKIKKHLKGELLCG